MRYWLYCEGNIMGPYSPAELMAIPAFAQSSLVCPETATGDNPGDWRSAEQVAEIAEALIVGVGSTMPALAGAWCGTYEPGEGFSFGATDYHEAKGEPHYGYESLLNTIDNILGAYKEAEAPAQPRAAEPDYALMDRFDIRLSKIQEELEAARWEKNLLLERIRSKDREDQKNKERIIELEERLKGVVDKTEFQDKEIAQLRHLSELKEKSDTLKKIEEIKQESLNEQRKAAQSTLEEEKRLLEIKPEEFREIRPALPPEIAPEPPKDLKAGSPRETAPGAQAEMKPAPARETGAAPQEIKPPVTQAHPSFPGRQPPPTEIKKAPESKPLKSIRPSHAIGLERTLESDAAAEKDERNLTSRKLMSLGHSQLQSFGPDDFKAQEDRSLDSPVRAASPVSLPQEPPELLPQQASGVVYDFTVVTKSAGDSEKVRFKIETASESAPASPQSVPGTEPSASAHAPAPAQTAPAPGPAQALVSQPTLRLSAEAAAPAYLRTQPVLQGGQSALEQPPAPPDAPQPSALGPKPSALSPVPRTEEAPGDGAKQPPADKTERIPVAPQKQKEESKKPQPGAGKSRSKLVFLLTLTVFGLIAAGGLGYFFLGGGTGLSEFSMLNFSGGKASKKASFSTQVEPKDEKSAQPDLPAAAVPSSLPVPDNAAAAAPAKPIVASASNENIRKALDVVKNYKLSGGRGSVSNWFANSFLSDSAQGLNEEWSATVLHGDIFVVQYRLLRSKHDPLVYLFEVDVAKAVIVRGINNNAMELLDFSSKATAKAEIVKKTRAPAARKSRRPGSVPILPLPDASGDRQASHEDPSGFENPAPDENEKVRYIKAQESDEELF